MKNGNKVILATPITKEYNYPQIQLKSGDYTVTVLGYPSAYIFARLMSQNIYTTQFATKAEVNSQISQTRDSITSSVEGKYATKNELTTTKAEIKQTTDTITNTVSKKVGNNEIISKINQSAEKIQISADKIDIEGKAVHFKTNISKTIGPFTQDDQQKISKYLRGECALTAEEFTRYDTNKDGRVDTSDSFIMSKAIANGGTYTENGFFEINPFSNTKSIALYNSNINKYIAIFSLINNYISRLTLGILKIEENLSVEGNIQCKNGITCSHLTETSLKLKKRNIKKLNINAMNLIRNADICLYNLKEEKNTNKKHIGLVIGEGYNCPKEVISQNGQGIEQYSMTSLAWKAIQELIQQNEEKQKIIENLTKRIEKLEEEDNKG